MKLVKSLIHKDGSGTVTLLPEEPEDMVRLSCFLIFDNQAATVSNADVVAFV